MTASATLNNYTDNRHIDPDRKPIWTTKATFVWLTGDGNTAQTVTLKNLNGTIRNIVANISSVTANPTIGITLTDTDSGIGITLSTLADGTIHYKYANGTDFNPMLVDGNVVLSVTPSADPGGSGQTLTIAVTIKGD